MHVIILIEGFLALGVQKRWELDRMIEENINELIRVYLLHCQLEKRLSPKTIKAYRIDLSQFLNYLGCNIYVCDKAAIQNYLSLLHSYFCNGQDINQQPVSATYGDHKRRNLLHGKSTPHFPDKEDGGELCTDLIGVGGIRISGYDKTARREPCDLPF